MTINLSKYRIYTILSEDRNVTKFFVYQILCFVSEVHLFVQYTTRYIFYFQQFPSCLCTKYFATIEYAWSFHYIMDISVLFTLRPDIFCPFANYAEPSYLYTHKGNLSLGFTQAWFNLEGLVSFYSC